MIFPILLNQLTEEFDTADPKTLLNELSNR